VSVLRLSEFKVLSFDCYGTLIDWETGIVNALAPLAAKCMPAPTPEALLALYARLESAQEAETPDLIYRELLARVHARIARELGVSASDALNTAFGASIGTWPAFPDSPAALAELKRHFKLVILSNVDRESFRATNARLGVEFDAILTAQDIGSYKPDPRNFAALIGKVAALGHPKHELLHVAQSLYHDHVPAQRAGLKTVWIDRRAGESGGATPAPKGEVRPDATYTSLAQFAEAHRREAQAIGARGA
jgi:2-haloacid dehalogenase